MNPDRTSGGMTMNALMQMGMIVSIAIAVVCIAILAFVHSQLTSGTFFLAALGCAIVVVLGIIIANWLVQRRIRERLSGLSDICRDYVGGDRTVRASVYGDDEFAVLSISLNSLLDNLSSTPAGAAFQTAPGSDAATLQAQIEKLLQEVSAVGDGDLRVQAEVTPDTLGVLADSFNYMIEELAKVVGRVQTTAVQVTNATRRILDRSAELAQASDTQAAQIGQTTEAVEALANFIQEAARNAQMCVEVAQQALQNASSGQQSVRQTIEGMVLIRENVQDTAKKIKRLGERSNEISEIVRIIDDIADQTNLLALNAAIQSAMAGEHGRGFAVVADEIRQLAERSTESTKRIETLIKSIQGDTYEAVVAMEDSTQEVVKGSQLADEAGRSLNSIYSAVERQAQMIEGIARAANEQTPVSEAVALAMSRISEITRQTNEGAQEAAVSVSYLTELSEQLRASVSTFRLPDRINENVAAFSPMTTVAELPNSGGQMVHTLNSGMESEWGQGFSGNFPPLPEPGNSGALVALSSRSSSQYSFDNQQDFGGQGGFGSFVTPPNQQGFDSQSFFAGTNNFSHGQQFNGQQRFTDNGQAFGDNQYFGGNKAPQSFDGQFDFGDMSGFDGQQSFAVPQYGTMGNQGQAFQQGGNQSSAAGNGQPGSIHSGQAPTQRPRRPLNSQNQASFNQEQFPYQNNG